MKIGIITQYYKSRNYGGLLQAYALCNVLNKMGCQAEQIAYKRESQKYNKRNPLKSVYWKLHNMCYSIRSFRIKKRLITRHNRFTEFSENRIPHSVLYDSASIIKAKDNYDAFITGSDQVWHPSSYCPAYGLEFVPSNKKKIAYAASIAVRTISEEYKNRLAQSIENFEAVSVRERDGACLLESVTDKEIMVTLDPTMLMTDVEWNDICSERKVKERYVFCYFLGDDIEQRDLAKKYAHEKNYTVVTLPYLTNKYRKCDKDFGDIQLYDICPAEFVSLIRHADVVFTDSFHAVAFSCIYRRQFIAFERKSKNSMASRIQEVTKLVNGTSRFCDSKEKRKYSYISSLEPLDYDSVEQKLIEERRKSKEFLYNSIFVSSL